MQTDYKTLIHRETGWDTPQITIISVSTNKFKTHIYLKIKHCAHNYLATGELINHKVNYLNITPLFSPFGINATNWHLLHSEALT